MEYYDSVNNTLLYSHYSQRNANILTNNEVISALDNTKPDKINCIGKKIQVFNQNETPYKTVSAVNLDIARKLLLKQNSMFNINNGRETRESLKSHNERENVKRYENEYQNFKKTEDSVSYRHSLSSLNKSESDSNLIRNSVFLNQIKSNKKYFNENIKKGVKSEIDTLNKKMDKIENIINTDIITQQNSFAEKMKMKKERMKMKPRKSLRYQVRKESKLDEVLIAIGIKILFYK